MPLDALGGVVGRVILWVLVEVLFSGFCFAIGFLFLRIVSLGRYPRRQRTDHDNSVCAGTGAVLLFVALLARLLIDEWPGGS